MQKFLRSFGRIKGHKLSDRQLSLIESFLPDIRPKSLENLTKLWIEIGFGSGSHLIDLIETRESPEQIIIGCEPYINGAVKVLHYLKETNIQNVFIQDSDGRPLLEELAPQSIEKFYLLFPDPWPKKKHHKRRIIQDDFLKLLLAKMAPGGLITIATDHQNYSDWIKEKIASYQSQSFLLKDFEACKNYGILTNYCQKALKKDLPIHLFQIIKN